ncbi:MAG: dihydrofolate reductase [Sporocytophaga sp.]|uniref:dihydrofolate reductase family protein n=1 Tax=Sporocytophaga sp. TaxID=2231183 RepID=UPI001B19C7EB|nr:dihydrofolate reductase family protein [Sporocytophaga sp.]MBO9701807.1 dihydrofolate reductase [Sporocytophaga sp.]
MRKLIFQMMISVDGLYEGPNKEIDWHNVDEEFNEYAIDLLNNLDILLFGRITFDLMASYWPTQEAIKDSPIVAERMNNLSKIVFSKKLKSANWQNTKVINENINELVMNLKKEQGKDMAIFGSSDLALTFIKHNLIDEYRIMVNPLVLGKGKRLFEGITEKLNLKLKSAKIFKSGNVMLCYEAF